MKKIIIVIFLAASVLLSSCVDFNALTVFGVFESEFPYMKICNFHSYPNYGETINKDGDKVTVIFEGYHGSFNIYEYNGEKYLNVGTEDEVQEMMEHMGEKLCSGKYRKKDDSIILIFEDGTRIVLNKVADEPENIEEYVNGFMTSDD